MTPTKTTTATFTATSTYTPTSTPTPAVIFTSTPEVTVQTNDVEQVSNGNEPAIPKPLTTSTTQEVLPPTVTPMSVTIAAFNEYVRDSFTGQIYAVSFGKKRWIQDLTTFYALGLNWEDVKEAEAYELSMPDGSPVPILNDGDVVYSIFGHILVLENGAKRRLRLEDFESGLFQWEKVRYDVDLSTINSIPF